MRERNPKLTGHEIEKLFHFVEKYGVKYKDVQCELVDHLACTIEELIAKNRSTSFDEALNKVCSKFPKNCFKHFIQGQKDAMNLFWLHKFGNYLLRFFTFPKILLTGAMTFLMHQFILSLGRNDERLIYFGYTFLVVLVLGKIIFRIKDYSKKRRKYLLLHSFYKIKDWVAVSVTGILQLFIVFSKDIPPLTNAVAWILAFLLSLYLVIGIGLSIVLPQYLKEEIENKYGHLNFAD